MGRMRETGDIILSDGSAHNHYGLTTAPIADLKYGAQNGYMPVPEEYIASDSFVKGDIIALLVEAPEGFADLEDPEACYAMLKALVEESPKTIEGFNSTLSVETIDTPIGSTQEVHQDIGRVTRARSEPVLGFGERRGRSIAGFHEMWITMFGLDPGTNRPGIVNYKEIDPKKFTPAYRSMTCLFIEPDVSFRKVVRSWLVYNMFPLTSGDIIGSRDPQSGGQAVDLSINYSGTTQIGAKVTEFAQAQLDAMSLNGASPILRPAFVDEISANIKSVETGYSDAIKKARG